MQNFLTLLGYELRKLLARRALWVAEALLCLVFWSAWSALLFGWAGLGADPEKATGLDGALKTMADLPAGSVVLAIIGAGLVLFGIYSVLRSRYAPM